MAAVFSIMSCFVLHLASGAMVNVALNKPASMSSSYEFSILEAGGVVDGDTRSKWPNVIHTAEHQAFAWWKVDLQKDVVDATVKIYFRTDYITRRNGVKLYTSTSPFSGQGRSDQLCHTVTGRADGTDINPIYSTTCPGTWRYLLIYTDTDNDGAGPMLDFGEVEVLVQTCDDGYYGEACDKQCSDRKCNTASPSSCDRLIGTCDNGCEPGWGQVDCTLECEAGFYGPGCRLPCHDRKCSDPSSECDRRTGQCVGGCQTGYQGADCTQSCSAGVNYGLNCAKNCSSRYCVRSPLTCDPQTGQCPDGCEIGWTGVDCANQVQPRPTTTIRDTLTPAPDTNKPTESSPVGAVVGSVFVTLLVVILLVVGLHILLIRRGRLQWVKRRGERAPIQIASDNTQISFRSTQASDDSEHEQPSRHVYNNDYAVLDSELMPGSKNYDVIQHQQYQNT